MFVVNLQFDFHAFKEFKPLSLIITGMKKVPPGGNELFDLSDAYTFAAYSKLKSDAKTHAISRDTSSWQEIEEAINRTTKQYSGNGIVLVSGAYRHIIGTIVHLAQSSHFNIDYIPVDGWQISTKTQDSMAKLFNPNSSGLVSVEDIQAQIERDLGVTKYLGYEDMEALRKFLDSREHDSKKPTLTFIAFNETGLHNVYTGEPFAEIEKNHIKNIMRDVISDEPRFVLATGEDWNIQTCNAVLEGELEANTPLQRLLKDIKAYGVPVIIDAFGHRDRKRCFSFRKQP